MAAKKRSTRKLATRTTAGKGKSATGKRSAGAARPTSRGTVKKAQATPKLAPEKAPKTALAPKSTSRPAKEKASSATGTSARSTKTHSPEAVAALMTKKIQKRADLRPVTSSVGLIHGISPYQPKPGEAYMNEQQLGHFRKILLAWKRELMEEVDRTVHHMQDEASNFPDPNDRATQESEFGLELRTRDRERKLLKKIDSALQRIEDGSYGYCEETGEEIGLRRLEARPVATLSVEAQERREVAERLFRDREDG